MKKSCKKGYYYCYTDKKCKKIPKGWHVMRSGYLVKDDNYHDKSETKTHNDANLNGDSSSDSGSMDETWSQKYKKSIDCDNPKGFSQLAHCQGRKKKLDEEGLRKWFQSKSKDKKPGWVDVVDGDACAREEGETATPKCVSSEKRASMSKAERLASQARKRRNDPNQPKKSGAAKPTYVKTDYTLEGDMNLQEVKDKPGKGSGTKDTCYHKVKSRYKVWPSAYASGALVKCRKIGASNWGESAEMIRYCPKCRKEETRKECKYGEKFWDMYSMPIKIKDYTPNTPHPGNMPESKDHEYSMARSEISTIISAAKRLRKKMKGEGNIKAWVQSKITKAADYLDTAADYIDSGEISENFIPGQHLNEKCWPGYEKKGMKKMFGKKYPNCVKKEEFSNWRADFGLSEDWQKVNRKDKTDGLSQKAVNAYRRENPGSKLQTAVTEKKPKGKRAKRRKNFCSRMSGMKKRLTSEKTARDPDSRINKALRRWNCN